MTTPEKVKKDFLPLLNLLLILLFFIEHISDCHDPPTWLWAPPLTRLENLTNPNSKSWLSWVEKGKQLSTSSHQTWEWQGGGRGTGSQGETPRRNHFQGDPRKYLNNFQIFQLPALGPSENNQNGKFNLRELYRISSNLKCKIWLE